MAQSQRARKVSDRIRVVVAEFLEQKIKDPRLGFVTITDVRITGDLQHASIFYTVLGGEDERAASAAALESAKGLLRSTVGKEIGVRLTPSLEFVPDAINETAAHLESILAEAAARDLEIAKASAGASYAGDTDPYKAARAKDDEEDE
ncbi:MAG TPA: 30S ribosome-binding factor RbfA [Candidatus Nanopelagicaceae bacterium]|nr:30S ribosome-binding factor RbfA [Candidatus Nanopelagicaceae bacterium]